ncbi:M23 family metallopeptidase [Vibrio cholerae]|nr:M23 family metallopeptidase [Vibrio cholerae]
MLRKMSIGLAWFSFSSGVLAHSLYPEITIHEIPLTKLTHSNLPTVLLSDNKFVYQPYLRPFDFEKFLSDTQPSWKSLQESLQHWAGATGVDPRVLITTLAILHPRDLPSSEDVKAIANQLSQRFYYYDSSTSFILESYTAATLAIAQQLPELTNWIDWQRQYVAWFEPIASEFDIDSTQPSLATLATMQWPWRQGYSWVPNGPHAHSGSGFPLSSIDVSYDWPQWGQPTYSVTAAHDGYVTVMSRCQVRVTNPNGWATNYYHMDGIQVGNNQWVTKDTKLGVYASQRSIALCEGGSSTGPHLHFSLLYNGRFQSLQGVRFGPYQIQTGRYSYDNDCRYSWLTDTRNQRKICLFQQVDNPAQW